MIQSFTLYNNTDLLPFVLIEKDTRLAKQFTNAMKFFDSSPGFETEHLLTVFDIASLNEGVVVDVGESHGVVSIDIAKAFPKLRCIVQDLGFTIEDATSNVPEHLKDRVTFMAHDYFVKQPVKNADIYYFRWIFHDLSVTYCTKILRALIPAFKPGARVIVNDICIAGFGQALLYLQKRMRLVDSSTRAS